MSARIARWSLLLLIVFVLAAWLPQLQGMLFGQRLGKTQLFYSPVIESFVYKEMVGEGHQFIYRDQAGQDYSRQAFEMLIPFIYYKNMELWGKLPLRLGGQVFDKARIRDTRQVLELDPRQLPEHAPRIPLYPLLESNPGRARLRLPENVFHPGAALDFTNSDANRLDPALTAAFSDALRALDFRFPARAAFGNVSILKPFDNGFFLLDTHGRLFHLKRRDGRPVAEAISLPADVRVRYLKVVENKRREFSGLLLADDGRVFLLLEPDHRLQALPLPDYDADRMELKILFNPLYRTAIYSDQQRIHAVAMDTGYREIARYSRPMAMAAPTLADRVWQALVPFSLSLHLPERRYLTLMPRWHGWPGLAGSAVALGLAVLLIRLRGARGIGAGIDLLLVALSGFYGLIALLLLPPDRVIANEA